MEGSTRYGYQQDRWDEMVEAGFRFLERLARRRGHTDYTTFCQEVRRAVGFAPQPGDHALVSLLGDVARKSFDERGVVVTALVHYKDQGFTPGPGFYAVSQELGLLPGGTLTDDQKTTFLVEHQRELESVYHRRRSRP